ncbi:MAG: DUF4843 domain-containing protein [Dysgonamonadaceae bacterium]|jgi:hypothetical protein|nr:DUF4843 domain-containing protein [Dysgonamonadaceae bacterium]
MNLIKYFQQTILLMIAGLILVACQKEEIPVYSGCNYLHFTRPSSDTLTLSFGVLPDVNEYRLPVPVTRIGNPTDKDMPCSLVSDASSTLSAKDYDLKSEDLIFHSGKFQDTLYVTLRKTSAMDNETFLLVLNILTTKDFDYGPEGYLSMPVYVTSKVEQPEWWNLEYTNAFFGPYTLTKYQWFIRATGKSDLSQVPVMDVIGLTKQFIVYLREKEVELGAPIKDENGRLLDTITYRNI